MWLLYLIDLRCVLLVIICRLSLLSVHLKTSKTRSIILSLAFGGRIRSLIDCLLSILILNNFETSKSTWWSLWGRLFISKRFVRLKWWRLLLLNWNLFLNLIKIFFVNIICLSHSWKFLHFWLVKTILKRLIHKMHKWLFQSWI